MAARMMDSAEQAGRKFTAGNMAYYAAKAARSGRRSYYTGRSDVMSPGCQIDGKARHEWLDEEIEFEFGDTGTLHDVITPARLPGPGTRPRRGSRPQPRLGIVPRLALRRATAPPSSCWWKAAPCVRPANAAASRTAPHWC